MLASKAARENSHSAKVHRLHQEELICSNDKLFKVQMNEVRKNQRGNHAYL